MEPLGFEPRSPQLPNGFYYGSIPVSTPKVYARDAKIISVNPSSRGYVYCVCKACLTYARMNCFKKHLPLPYRGSEFRRRYTAHFRKRLYHPIL